MDGERGSFAERRLNKRVHEGDTGERGSPSSPPSRVRQSGKAHQEAAEDDVQRDRRSTVNVFELVGRDEAPRRPEQHDDDDGGGDREQSGDQHERPGFARIGEGMAAPVVTGSWFWTIALPVPVGMRSAKPVDETRRRNPLRLDVSGIWRRSVPAEVPPGRGSRATRS